MSSPPPARRWGQVAVGVVVGALAVGGFFAVPAIFGGEPDPARADAALGKAFTAISPVDSQRCPRADRPLDCLRATAQRNEHEFRRFLARLDDIDFPSGVDRELAAVRRDVGRFCRDLAAMAAADSVLEFQRAAGAGDVAQHSRRAYADVQALHRALQALA